MRAKLPEHVPRDHPVVTQQYAVYTPAIAQMVTQVSNWIDQQRSGYIWGFSRYGKTRGVQYYLATKLGQRFGGHLPLLIYDRPEFGHPPTAGQFWEAILRAGGHRYASTRTSPDHRLHLVVEMFKSLAKRSEGNFVVLLIDEAQSMTVPEWRYLVALQNHLDFSGIRLSVISIGSHQMGYVYDQIAIIGDTHCAARFLIGNARFPGIRSIEELQYVLFGYDEDSEWPEQSGVSYTQALAPDLFVHGFRLSAHAEEFWKALDDLLPDGYHGLLEFPMLHIAHTVESTLLGLAGKTPPTKLVTQQGWKSTLEETDFPAYMRLISAHCRPRKRP